MSGSNSPSDHQMCWVLVGPTASGKTAVALELARRHPIEIVSVDSMQVYRGMDIGTAKPSPEQRAAVPHHLIDVLEPEEGCNAGLFRRMANEAIGRIQARGRRPLLVGGTPLYLKALVWGLIDAPGSDPGLRARLTEEAERGGAEVLHLRLSHLDPVAAARIHPNDVHRLVRALEVRELTGRPISAGQDQFDGPVRLRHRMAGLRWPRPALYARIERRVDRMVADGLLEEVATLRGRLGRQARQAVGYKELMAHLEGRIALPEAVRLIKRNTRRLAKHQLTWWRHFPQTHWVDAHVCSELSELADRCAAVFALSPS
jgi:tRNA dimethylallyltransferase